MSVRNATGRICAVGDNVVDRYVDQRVMYPGGNAVNVAVHARRCGSRTAYVGVVGDDAAGTLLLDVLAREGVDASRVRSLTGPNAYATVRLVEGERVFGFGSVGVSRLTLGEPDLDYLRGFELVHTGDCSGLEAQLPDIAAAAPVSFDFAERNATYAEPLLPYVRIATFSRNGATPDEVAELITWAHDRGPSEVLVTRGAAGATLSHRRRVYHWPAQPVRVVDTLGAGDAFIARACVELLGGTSPGEVLARATEYAADACRTVGAFGYPTEDTLPWPERIGGPPAGVPNPVPDSIASNHP